MKAGFSRIDITPQEQVPLAGYFHFRERISRRISDRLYCRTVVFDDGKTKTALVSLDLLIVPPAISTAVKAFCEEKNIFPVIHASHTHSSFGGIWDNLPAKMTLGRYRKHLADNLLACILRGISDACADLQEARVGAEKCMVKGLNGNRRDPYGPVDEELIVVIIEREKERGILVNYPAHPVIVGERDHYAVSADFPGEVVQRLENSGFSFAVYLNGALGGVDVLFPSGEMGVEENLRMMVEPLVEKAHELAQKVELSDCSLEGASETIKMPEVDSNPFFDDTKFLRFLFYPLIFALNAVFAGARPSSTVMNAFSIGNILFLGTPADLGVGIALELKRLALERGFIAPIVMSQCDDYVGYYHLPEEYLKTPPRKYMGMAMYENAMAIYGHGFGKTIYDTGARLISRLKLQ